MRTFVWLLFFLIFSGRQSFAQDVTGIWKGYFTTEYGDSYRVEFQVAQQKSGLVTGVSYSYGDNVRFYGKATMTGRFARTDKGFKIQETRTTEVRMQSGSGTELMNYNLLYSRSGREEYLEGFFIGRTEDRLNPANNGPWGSGGTGKVFLRRVKESDFYTEPFLRNKIKPVAPPVAVKPAKLVPPLTRPGAKPPVQQQATTKPATKPPVKVPAIVKTQPPTQTPQKKDTQQRRPVETVIIKPTVITPPKIAPLPVTTRARTNELTQTFTVSSNEINIKLYDNGEIDDDTISVYLDGKPLALNRRLSTVPISLNIKLDESSPEHTLVMVAENMGRIPPNTSLMVVEDGDKRYKAGITSTEQKNAMVRFRYEKRE